MNNNDIKIISENIVKPKFLIDLHNSFKLFYYINDEENTLTLRVILSVINQMNELLKFINWIKYRNKEVTFDFNVINWDDLKEHDFQNSEYSLTLQLNCLKSNKTYDLFQFIRNHLNQEKEVSKVLENIFVEEYLK